MSEHPDESRDPRESQADGPREGITDEDLPEDLQPHDDNPLAQPLEGEDAKSPEELDMRGGKVPEQRADDNADSARTEDDSDTDTDSDG